MSKCQLPEDETPGTVDHAPYQHLENLCKPFPTRWLAKDQSKLRMHLSGYTKHDAQPTRSRMSYASGVGTVPD